MKNKRAKGIRKLLVLFVALAMTISLTACASSTSNEKTQGESAKSETVTISWGVQKPKKEADEAVYNKVAEEYMKLNPKVKVKMAYTEYSDDAQWVTWLNSQLVGGAAPDVVWSWHIPAMENYRKGLVVDLKPYLQKQNPYDSKQRTWWDSYATGLINQNMDNTNGAVPSVPLSTVAVKVYYNKDLFAKAGITNTPKTFGELLAVSEKLKTAGIIPFIAPNKSPVDNVFNWLHRMFMDQMIAPLIPQLDLDKSGLVELNEIVAGARKGIIDLEKSPWTDSVELIKTFSKYWYPGYNGIDTATATDLFIKQQGAMMMQTGNNLKSFIDNPDRKFEIGFFSFPYLTKHDSANAVEEMYEMGGSPINDFCIPSSVKGDKLAAAVNFLQFLASEKGAALFADGFWWTPAIKDAELPNALKGMFIEGKTSSLRLLAPQMNQKLYQDDTMLGQLFLEGKTSAKDFNSTLNKDLKSSVDQLSKQNGWTEENGWGLKK